MPVSALTIAMRPSATGEPTSGMTRNGTHERPDDRPERVGREQEPGATGDLLVLAGHEGRGGREAQAHDERGRQDDQDRPLGEVADELADRLGQVHRRAAQAVDQDDHPEHGQDARSRAGRPPAGPTIRRSRVRRRLNASAPRARPSRKTHEDEREDVGRVAGARRDEPGPQDLVGEGGQARHEREHDREPGAAAGRQAGRGDG